MSETETPPPDRADVLKRSPEISPLYLDGDFLSRMQLGLTGMLSYLADTLRGGGALPRFQLTTKVVPEIALADFTVPPFRRNGKAFSLPFSSTAGGGTLGAVLIANRSKGKVLVIDGVNFANSAASVVQVVMVNLSSLAGVTTTNMLDLEAQQTGDPIAGDPIISQGTLTDLLAGTLGATPGVGQLVWTFPAPGFFPLLLGVVWPGSTWMLEQTTINLTLSGTIWGRVWDFGEKVPGR